MRKFAFALQGLILLALVSGCTPLDAVLSTAEPEQSRTAAVIHTWVAGTMLADTALAHTPSITPTMTMPQPAAAATLSPTATITPAGAPTAVLIPTMVDVPLLEGYRGYGSRVLAQPVGVVRDGITVAVEQAAVYADRVELVYTVRDIPHDSLFDPMNDDLALSCDGPVKYPNLLLPDGTVIYPENYLLDGKARGMFEPFASTYLIHLYRASIPAEVTDLTMYLGCLELPRLDRAPQDWYVPFKIVPAGG